MKIGFCAIWKNKLSEYHATKNDENDTTFKISKCFLTGQFNENFNISKTIKIYFIIILFISIQNVYLEYLMNNRYLKNKNDFRNKIIEIYKI